MSKKSIDEVLADLDKTPQAEEKGSSKTKVKFRKKKMGWKKRIFFIILGLLLIGGGYFGFKAYGAMRNIFQNGGALPNLLGIISDTTLKGEKEDRINILLLGMGGDNHQGGTLTDTMMVVSIKPSTKQVSMLSIPRDLYVKIGYYGYNKINAAHAFGEQYKYSGGGIALAKETVQDTLNIDVHYIVRVDFAGFEKMIDTVGGIDVFVEKDLYDPYYPEGGTFTIARGQTHMDGALALKYARSRETTSDFDRAKRQQIILVALKDKLLSLNTLLNPKKISDVLGILGDHIKTDMSVNEAVAMGKMIKDINQTQIINKVLDNGSDGFLVSSTAGGMYILEPKNGDFEEIQNYVNNIFTASVLDDENATIEVLNGSGVSGQAKALAEQLESEGYSIVNIDTNDELAEKTAIIDHTGNKGATIAALEKELLVKASLDTTTTSSYDITIIVGKDH